MDGGGNSMASLNGHRYCIYARVSPKGSTWSAHETSIQAQLQECREYVSRMDPDAVFSEVFDEFRSGKDLERPGMQEILADIESARPSFDTLVVWQLDRLSRNLADAAPLFEKLRDAGLGFISIRQSYLSATGAMARFNLTQTIAIAQLEREMTSERISAKLRWLAQQGKVAWGKLPIGYRRKPGVKNTAEIVPEDAELIKKIFALYLAGCDQNDFSDLNNFWAIHRERLGDTKKMYRILRNRFYIGEVVHHDEVFPGEHTPIIDRGTFDAVQAKLPGAKYNVARPGRQKYAYLLSGLVRCHCNPERYMRPASVKKKTKRYFYYKCTDSACGCEINAEKLDAAVLDAIQKIALDPEYVRECYEAHQQQIAELKRQQEPKINAALQDIEKAKADLQKIDELFLNGVVRADNADYWNEKLIAARSRAGEAEQRYKQLVSDMEPLSKQDKLSAILESITGWASLLDDAAEDTTLKRNLILSLVYRVRCLEHGKFAVDLILDGTGKKKIDITPDEVMSNGGDWWRWRESNPRVD